jgi:hypothetical protein
MKAAEILRKLADMIDTHSDGEDTRPANSVPHAELASVEVDHTDNTETSTFVAPLQAKLELLKKSLGMDNAYDTEDSGCETCGAAPCGCEANSSELELIKQRAGIPVAITYEMADDDGPFEG